MKLTEYQAITALTSDNIYIVDGNNGTKKILVADAINSMLNLISPMAHCRIFRGKNLGVSLTTAQKSAIEDGSFNDLYLGDYWVIGGVNWRIVDFDYWYNNGDTPFTSHHCVIMPDSALYNAVMNPTAITTGGYVGSQMYTTNLANAKTTINTAFSGSVLTHREYLTNTVANGKPSAGSWYDSAVDLPNECMMYGHSHFSPCSDGTTAPMIHTICKSQLGLFQVAPKYILNTSRAHVWLRDVITGASFGRIEGSGLAGSGDASSSNGVRPVFAIG